jgi:hypothetical protein
MSRAAVRLADGRFEAADRALAAAQENQYRQLRSIFAAAGIPAHTLAWGHTGTLSNNQVAKLINWVSLGRFNVAIVDPHDYGLVEGERRRR